MHNAAFLHDLAVVMMVVAGGAFGMIGGEQSFGEGRYADAVSALELVRTTTGIFARLGSAFTSASTSRALRFFSGPRT